MSAPQSSANGVGSGRAYVYFGGAAANATADWTLTGLNAQDRLGFAVGAAGDVNGDRYADIVIGADNNDAGGPDAGQAYVYYGGSAPDANPDLTFTGEATFDLFGRAVGAAGDVNGDAYSDVIVAAPLNDAGGAQDDNWGRAYVYLGGPGADGTADLTFTGQAAGDEFGTSVGTAGDFDGDSFADIVVGAYLNDAGGNGGGRVYVTAIYPYQVVSPNGGEQWVAGKPATIRWFGHDMADVGLSLDGGLSWTTLAVGVGSEEENAITITAPGMTTESAKVRLSTNGQPVSHSTSDASDGVFRIVLPHTPPTAAHRLALFLHGSIGWRSISESPRERRETSMEMVSPISSWVRPGMMPEAPMRGGRMCTSVVPMELTRRPI